MIKIILFVLPFLASWYMWGMEEDKTTSDKGELKYTDVCKKPKISKEDLVPYHSNLFTAISGGFPQILEQFLKQGGNPNAAFAHDLNDQARLPLLVAVASRKLCNEGHVKIVELLLQAGADVNACDSRGYTALMEASGRNYLQIVKLLLQAKADVNHRAKDTFTALTFALSAQANVDNKEVLLLLIDAGADVNITYKSNSFFSEDGITPLMVAAAKGYEKVVELALKKGAHVNARTSQAGCALMDAVGSGRKDIVEMFLDNKADVAAKTNEGLTVLMVAAAQGNEEIVRLVLDRGADCCINAQDNKGKTALMIAAENNNTQVIELLLARGANPHITDKKGLTALMYVKYDPFFSVIQEVNKIKEILSHSMSSAH